jgi:hypothetical protein
LISDECEYVRAKNKNSGPSNEPESKILRFSRKRLQRFEMNYINLWRTLHNGISRKVKNVTFLVTRFTGQDFIAVRYSATATVCLPTVGLVSNIT